MKKTSSLSYGSAIQYSTPIQRLLYAVIDFGVREGDIEYFLGEIFEYHCEILQLDSDLIREKVLKQLGE